MNDLDPERQILFKATRKLNHGHYIVEISKIPDSLLIAAFDHGSPENYIIELQNPKDEEIMKEFNGDYELLSENLNIMNRRLVLLNPVSLVNKECKALEERKEEE
jgi:hypothetical protein